MSQIENAVTSSSKEKRSYRKGKPMSASERQLAAIARKRETHKEVKVFVKNPLKDWMITICEEEGLTQAQFISSSHRYATGPGTAHIVTTFKKLTQKQEQCLPEPSQPLPTTEKRGRPGPKGRNYVAFNNRCCN